MRYCLVLLSTTLFCLAYANREPKDQAVIFPRDQEIHFPGSESDQDIYFPDSKKFKIRGFHWNSAGHLPKPNSRRWRSMNAYRPGQPFPPPSNGHYNKNRKNQPREQQRLCERKHSEYIERIFANDKAVSADADDVDFDGRVLVRPGEYPHMAALGFETNSQIINYKCGGSLISENFILTAAHCTDVEGEVPKWVRVGGLNLMIDEITVEPQNFGIESIFEHPDYKNDLYYNDIALLKLDGNVILTEFVRPIRLWSSEEIPTSIAFAMGYGSTSFGKGMTYRLTHLNATLVPNSECDEDLPDFEETPYGIIASQICAQDFIQSRDTCQGDSGGPLQLNLPGRRRRHVHYHLIGITSFGVFCRSSYPSVYTRVSSYLDWIEQITWGMPSS
ncbi:serine protease snake [Drosophila grimshawi]|uniref:GH21866 n=1 Tax=Drosophila grimshawi TaxID=7222 RepID=B4JS23_DROGR|nr:serine protease snake [Drosophila grimshawi]EDV94563.1 GH21866 [Drosophila grimshawi]